MRIFLFFIISYFFHRIERVDLNNKTSLEKKGFMWTDFWTPSVQGSFGEPCKCYTYQPKGQRKIGFTNMVKRTQSRAKVYLRLLNKYYPKWGYFEQR